MLFCWAHATKPPQNNRQLHLLMPRPFHLPINPSTWQTTSYIYSPQNSHFHCFLTYKVPFKSSLHLINQFQHFSFSFLSINISHMKMTRIYLCQKISEFLELL